MKYDIGLFLKGFLGICLKAFKIIEIKNKQRKDRWCFFQTRQPGSHEHALGQAMQSS